MKRVFGAILVATLCGCVTPEQERAQVEQMANAINSQNKAICRLSGLKEGTAEFKQCEIELILKRVIIEGEARERRAEAGRQAAADALINFGASVGQARQRTETRCTAGLGGDFSCTTY